MNRFVTHLLNASTLATTSNMAAKLYQKLDIARKEIRLVRLDPAPSYEDRLIGKLLTVSLLEKPQFRALSYVCGNAEDTKCLTLSETEVPIYKNLDRALRHVRSTQDPLTLWIDQLSIHQTDLEERSQQVRLMSDIYDMAFEVLAHLDSSSDSAPRERKHVDSVAETVKTLGRLGEDEHYNGPIEMRNTWSDLLRFFRNSYWFRMWTSQELILAKKVIFYYEKYPIAGDVVDAFLSCGILAIWATRGAAEETMTAVNLTDSAICGCDTSIFVGKGKAGGQTKKDKPLACSIYWAAFATDSPPSFMTKYLP